MTPFTKNILFAALNELKDNVDNRITDPQIKGSLKMVNYLLAYVCNASENTTYNSANEERSITEETINQIQQTLNTQPNIQGVVLNAELLTPYGKQSGRRRCRNVYKSSFAAHRYRTFCCWCNSQWHISKKMNIAKH